MISTCVLIVMVMELVNGYSNGAPSQVCGNMMPSHGAAAQTSSSPYTITLSASSFKCDEAITVTLGGSSSFKGFLCQARPAVGTYVTSGQLVASGNVTMTNNCGTANAALTHTEDGAKTTAVFTWTPPSTEKTNVYFLCTVVQEKTIFWVKQSSAVLTYSNTMCSSSGHMATQVLPTMLCLLFSIRTFISKLSIIH